MRKTALLNGYREIRTPVVEHTELFARSAGESSDVVRKEMYTFMDKGERSITLKPESTAGTVSSATGAPVTEPPVTEAPTAPTTVPTTTPPETVPPTTVPPETAAPEGKYLVVIDAGHQAKANYDKEPVGPGAAEMKTKVSSGTQGKFTGLEEYKLNLVVSLFLRDILEGRGYEVVMIRTTHDVGISNAQRAEIANELQADAFIRVHANGSDDPSVSGIMTLCQTPENPYNGDIYDACKLLSTFVLDETVAATGANRQFVWETDTMSGINWCAVPVTIVEMGYMSNETEDRAMATEEYQRKLAEGIANGIDRYFENISQ